MNSIELQLKRLKQEYARQLQEETLRCYRGHGQQVAFHKSRAAIRALFGGNQSGKSRAGAQEIAEKVGGVLQYRPNKGGIVRGRDCAVTFGRVVDVLLPTYQEMLPRQECKLSGTTYEGKERIWPGLKTGTFEGAYDKQYHVITLANGSFIEFKSYDQGYENFAGPPRDIIRLDEEPKDERILDECLARFVTTGVDLLATLTPIEYTRWLYQRIYQAAATNPNIECFKLSIYDNPFADPQVIEIIENSDMDPAEKAARLYGEFTYLSGRVWKEYGGHNLCRWFLIPDHWRKTIVIDPHTERKTAVNWFASNQQDYHYGYREADLGGDVDEICDQIRQMSADESIDRMIIDKKGSESKNKLDKRQGSIFDEFKKRLPMLIKGNPNFDVGVEKVRSLIKDRPGRGPKLCFMESCPITHFQMMNASWKPKTRQGEERRKAEMTRREVDHADNTRYFAMDVVRFEREQTETEDFEIAIYAN